MNPISISDDIERQLATMRSVLHQDVRDLATEARTLVDWRYHFRAHPWLYCGGTAALGFMLVPARKRSLRVEAAVVTDTDDDPKVVLQLRDTAHSGGSFLKTMLTLAATAVIRESLGYLIQRSRRDP